MKNILLTCFGGNVLFEVYDDFSKRDDIRLFVADMNPFSKARFLVKNFICLLPAEDPDYIEDLLQKARQHDLDMIIPGGDEEALRLMPERKRFEKEGVVVAVQDEWMMPLFSSKSAMYDYLKSKGFPVPFYRTFRSKEQLEAILEGLDYPQTPYLVKPNSARGGRGITILSERIIPNRDNLTLYNRKLFDSLLSGEEEFILMDYIEGVVYDIDVLAYRNGQLYFGPRKRFTNVTKNFCGNIFDHNEQILDFSRKLYSMLPTKYLLDYDFMVTENGRIELLEVNPRPSGSTVSYIPFGVNLYYLLAKSYLDNEHLPVNNSMLGQQAVTFHKMVKGGLL